MLKKFRVTNYKNFKAPLTLDFSKVSGYQFNTDCIDKHMISKMLIYGRNSTGKTNLGRAIYDITEILLTSPILKTHKEFFLNADATSDYARFEYAFQFDSNEVVYNYSRREDTSLVEEEMFINGNRIFCCDFSTLQTDFSNLELVGAETVQIDRYMDSLSPINEDESETVEKLPFLRWLTNNAALPPDSVLLKMYSFIRRMRFATADSLNFMYYSPSHFYQTLENESSLKAFEEFLNVMGVDCKLSLEKLPDGKNQLYFMHSTPIPFSETASSGTLALTTLYRRLKAIQGASFVYLDEFDAFYHYEMSENVVRYIKFMCPNCQVIFTTHNTNLMSNHLMRPDCLFILSRSGTLTPLCEATRRELREGHNLEKMYISGEFEKYE